jgi:hypothetical protein
MVPVLIYLLYKKFRKSSWPRIRRVVKSKTTKRSGYLVLGLIVLLLLITIGVTAQEQTLKYAVVRKGNEVGWIRIQKNASDHSIVYHLDSEIKTRIIFQFTASAKEETEFEDGRMIYSSLFRKMNGNIKADKQTRLTGSGYIIQKGDDKQKIALPLVTYSLHCLYFQEPVNIKQVYSDNFERFINIERIGDGQYRLRMPDGVTNYFYYSKGVCFKVHIDHSFYSAEIILKS